METQSQKNTVVMGQKPAAQTGLMTRTLHLPSLLPATIFSVFDC